MKTSITLASAGVAALALGGAFVLGATVGPENWGPSGGDDRSRPHAPAQAVAAGQPLAIGDLSLVAAGSCDALLDWYVDNTRDQVTAWGWGGGMHMYDGVDLLSRRTTLTDSANAVGPWAAAPGERARVSNKELSQTSSETGTNVQEVGVDEPDVVKTDGSILVRLVEDDLVVYDVTGEEPERLSSFDLPGRMTQPGEFLLVGDRAVVVSQRSTQEGQVTRVDTVSLEEPDSPELLATTSYDASLLSARQYGDTVRLILGTGLPMLDFVTPQGELTQREALRRNRAVLEESTIADWLPHVDDDNADGGDDDLEQLVDCADMARPEDFAGAGTVSIVGWSADDPQDRSSTGVATGSQIVYSSTDRLYLATSAWGGGCCVVFDSGFSRGWPGPFPGPVGEDGTTQVHAFALDGGDASYVGSGEVEGSVRDRWAMDAVDGTLRVAVGPTSQTGDWNSVVTLEEKDGALEPLGRVDKLGVNEQIMSVRWFDDLAVLVTFRQVDPLYAIDLSDPARPKALGELKIPGYSDYLHPIGGDRILGLGVNADERGVGRGAQAAVFDLEDVRSPKRLDVETYGPRITLRAGQEPRQFTWVPSQKTAYAVISRDGFNGGTTAWVSVLTINDDGTIDRRNRAGTTGWDDVAALRTVPLPDGRVAVVTEDTARFL